MKEALDQQSNKKRNTQNNKAKLKEKLQHMNSKIKLKEKNCNKPAI